MHLKLLCNGQSKYFTVLSLLAARLKYLVLLPHLAGLKGSGLVQVTRLGRNKAAAVPYQRKKDFPLIIIGRVLESKK